MNESKNFRIVLLSGGSNQWSEAVIPILLAQSECFRVVETVDELLSIPPDSKPEMIFICHQPGTYDGIAAAEKIREYFILTPKVLLSDGKLKISKVAYAAGVCAVLESPFTEENVIPVFNQCSRIVQTLRWEALKQQQNRNLSELFIQAPFCHLFVDADGTVTFHNNEAAKVVGVGTYSVIEFTKLSQRFFAPHASTYPLDLETAVQNQMAWNGILTGRLPDTSLRVYRVVSIPATLTDGASGVLLTLHDITTVHSEQANLRIALQAARDSLTLADAGGNITELLQLSNPEFHVPLSLETFSLQTLLNSVKGNATLTIPDYLPGNFQGDAKRLGYIFRAILDGSTSFGESAPRISLSIKERTPSRITIQFSIRVESKTIPSDSYQNTSDYLATAGQMPHAVSGLGLAAVLVKQVGGTMLIRTERSASRTITFNVPLKPGVDEFVPVSPASINLVMDESPNALPSLKVLLAEDNLLEQTTLKHLLEDIGCQTIVVGNGKEAVDEFENGEFDVVLMDILMPVMDGFEATRLIREREMITGGAIPVVALTSYSLKAIQDKCVSVGMDGYLAKPVAKQKLVDALQRLSKLREPYDPLVAMQLELETLPVLDTHEVLENIGFGVELYKEMVEMYLTTFVGQGTDLAVKLAGNDLKEILECAHSLKGTLSNIGGKRLAEVARQIQDMCIEKKKPDSAVWVPIVNAQTAAVNKALELIDWDELTRFVADK